MKVKSWSSNNMDWVSDVYSVPSILCDGWVKATTVSRQFLFFYTWSGMKINVMTTELQPIACKHEPECSISNWNWPFSSCCLGQRQISHSHNDTNHNTRLVFSFTFESIFNFSLIHSQPMSSKTLSLAKISFWQTMQWIKGHTWPLSCSLGDQTHFQGQELLTSLFNQGGETRNLR